MDSFSTRYNQNQFLIEFIKGQQESDLNWAIV